MDMELDFKLDAATLAELRDESEELLFGLIDLFAVEPQKHLAALAASVAAGDRVVAERAAHTLKGSAATLGALAMRDCAFAVEQAARAGELETVSRMLEPLQGAYQRAVADLMAEKERISRAMSANDHLS